ncbi:MAG: N-acetylmuramic acid 6-phosphate etherase [Candidatus Brockarchaeota archaeon]|nr:N-acetylmuramic acid 6-phosphate etherase [Candidatus Brockarchaeota archaeon]
MDAEFEKLLTEHRNPRTVRIDRVSVAEALKMINREDKKVAKAVELEIPKIAKAVETVVKAFRKGGRLIYVGAGTSGRIGVIDAAECPPTFGTSPRMVQALIAGGRRAMFRAVEGAEDNMRAGVKDIKRLRVSERDVVIGLSASGRAPYVIGALKEAMRRGAETIAVATVLNPRIGKYASIVITPIVGPEVIAGSTRMKAGTAEKMVLNMISTVSMVRIGKVYTNLMIDIKPLSVKLRSRARRLLRFFAGVSSEEAEEIYRRSKYDLKVALVMALARVEANDARKALRKSQGLVWRAIRLIQEESARL